MERETLHRLLHDMLLARVFEERAAEEYTKGNIVGFLHLYPGEEAVGAVENDGQFAGCAGPVLLPHAAGEDPRMPAAHNGFRRCRNAKAESRNCIFCRFQWNGGHMTNAEARMTNHYPNEWRMSQTCRPPAARRHGQKAGSSGLESFFWSRRLALLGLCGFG